MARDTQALRAKQQKENGDVPDVSLETALAYRDKDGRKLAPVLPLPPIENKGGERQLSNLAKTHQLLAAHAGAKVENLYGAVFQGILNEKVTTKSIQTNTPFRWVKGTNAR
jgi:hypothetical protein